MPKSGHLQNRRVDGKKDECCSVSFLKYIVFIFNFFFLIGGIAVLSVGIWTLIHHANHIVLLTTKTFASSTALLITAGVVVIISTFVGFFAIGKENRCFLLIYTFSLLLVFLLEAVGGVMAYVYEEQVMVDLSHSLTKTFNSNYGKDTQITSAIDSIQEQYKCCGAVSFSQWEKSDWRISNHSSANLVPESCCKSPSYLCARRDGPSNIWYTGCIYRIEEELGRHLLILGATGCGISILQVVGLILSCCLYAKLKESDQDY